MDNNNAILPTVELISGAYSSRLWDNLCDICAIEESTAHIYTALEALHETGRNQEAFSLIRALYDLAGLDLPDDVAVLDRSDETCKAYIAELLLDIEDII